MLRLLNLTVNKADVILSFCSCFGFGGFLFAFESLGMYGAKAAPGLVPVSPGQTRISGRRRKGRKGRASLRRREGQDKDLINAEMPDVSHLHV